MEKNMVQNSVDKRALKCPWKNREQLVVASYQNIKYSNASTTWRSLLTTCATFENKNLLGDTLFLYKNYETKKSSVLQFNSEYQKRACFLFWANITHSSRSPSPSKYNTHDALLALATCLISLLLLLSVYNCSVSFSAFLLFTFVKHLPESVYVNSGGIRVSFILLVFIITVFISLFLSVCLILFVVVKCLYFIKVIQRGY